MKHNPLFNEIQSAVLDDSNLVSRLDRVDPTTLRQRILALAQLKLFEAMAAGATDTDLINSLLSIIKPLCALDIRERDLASKRQLMHERALARDAERASRRKEAEEPPSNPAPKGSIETPASIPQRPEATCKETGVPIQPISPVKPAFLPESADSDAPKPVKPTDPRLV